MYKEDIEKAILDLEYLQAMMTFDPMTGEELNIENDNEENRSLYKSVDIAIKVLREQFIFALKKGELK